MSRIQVVCGALSRDTENGRQYLMGIRKRGGAWAGAAEFPGGKLEPGETSREALYREWGEELSLQPVAAASPIAMLIYEPPAVERAFDITMYRVEADSPPLGVPMPAHEYLFWASCTLILSMEDVTPSTHAFTAFLHSLDRLTAGTIRP
jgi:mutator protein MutT